MNDLCGTSFYADVVIINNNNNKKKKKKKKREFIDAFGDSKRFTT